jgi:hypothetical protein
VGPRAGFGRGGEEKNSQPLPENEPPDHLARSLAELSRLLLVKQLCVLVWHKDII